jgi:hypothetical protein
MVYLRTAAHFRSTKRRGQHRGQNLAPARSPWPARSSRYAGAPRHIRPTSRAPSSAPANQPAPLNLHVLSSAGPRGARHRRCLPDNGSRGLLAIAFGPAGREGRRGLRVMLPAHTSRVGDHGRDDHDPGGRGEARLHRQPDLQATAPKPARNGPQARPPIPARRATFRRRHPSAEVSRPRLIALERAQRAELRARWPSVWQAAAAKKLRRWLPAPS